MTNDMVPVGGIFWQDCLTRLWVTSRKDFIYS